MIRLENSKSYWSFWNIQPLLKIQKISLYLELVILYTLLNVKGYKIFNCRNMYLVEEVGIDSCNDSANSEFF